MPTRHYDDGVSTFPIRTYGDPVLKQRIEDLQHIDDRTVQLVENMFATMYAAPGSGLAANQIGVRQRVFVYDVGDGRRVVINPRIVESSGEWTYDEGCLSVPGLSWPIVRPKEVHLVGVDLEGRELSIEADTLEARVLQHELDHLDGVLLVEHLDAEQRREAKRLLRSRVLAGASGDPDGLLG